MSSKSALKRYISNDGPRSCVISRNISSEQIDRVCESLNACVPILKYKEWIIRLQFLGKDGSRTYSVCRPNDLQPNYEHVVDKVGDHIKGYDRRRRESLDILIRDIKLNK